MLYLFAGDSLTEASNNEGVSFADYTAVDGEVKVIGVSGTTVDRYSLYPVNRYDLLSQINRHADTFAQADVIFIEYGLNDIAAVLAGNVTYRKVMLAFRRAIDALRQIAPKATLVYLYIGPVSVIKAASKLQVRYLREEYLKGLVKHFSARKWARLYTRLVNDVAKLVPTALMFCNAQEYVGNLDKDKLHPNDYGYSLIGQNLTLQLGWLGL